MHRAEHRVEDMAIKVRKAHSLLVERFLSSLSLGARLPFWCGAESPAIAMDHWVEVKHHY